MSCQIKRITALLVLVAAVSVVAGVSVVRASELDVLRRPETEAARAYKFSAADEAMLEEIERACFQYFWKEVGSPACLVKDRRLAEAGSAAAIGFQLSSLPIGVERGWITRSEGEKRALTVLKALINGKDNRRFGVYLHFPDHNTGGMSHSAYEVLASTVDTALLIAGAIPAGEYFGGEAKAIVDRMIKEADWKAFTITQEGFLSMGWHPKDRSSMSGPGEFLQAKWHLASDEERIVYFLAVGSPAEEHAVDPAVYYRLERIIKRHKEMPQYAASFGGPLFNYFFSHCWIDLGAFEADDPSKFGVSGPRVDWFENSRRASLTHRQRCIENADKFKTFAEDRWGLSACAARDGYLVPAVMPNMFDADNWGEGTVAPYAAGSMIMFTPTESVAALRAFRGLKRADGKPYVWWDPSEGGYGLVDCFNMDQGFASKDYVGIDHGPMLLAIENARTGLIWRLFMQHETSKRAISRLKWERRSVRK